ncbi:perilipin-3 isoform X1 [Prionailurus iriomotensis]
MHDSRGKGSHQPHDGRVLGHVLNHVVKGLSGLGHLLSALRQDSAGQVLEGMDARKGGLEALHLVASLLNLVLHVGGQPLDAGAQRGTGVLQLLGNVATHEVSTQEKWRHATIHGLGLVTGRDPQEAKVETTQKPINL